MKLPLNKKKMMLPGIGIVVFGIAVMGMLYMKRSKTPPADPAAQDEVQGGEKTGGADGAQNGTATAKLEKTDKEKKEKAATKLPYVYKQNATTIFKPLSSNELSKMIKEVEAEKHKYAKRNEVLDLKEKTLESLRADMDAERKELDALKQELSKMLDSVATQKVALKKETIQFDEVESKNIKKLAGVYGGMKPEKAAMIIKEMDEGTAVKLLTMMDGKSSGKILESFEPSLAVKLSEKLKLLKSDFKSAKK